MINLEDYGGETIKKPENEQLCTVELSTDIKKCRAIFIHIPVHNTHHNVDRGNIIDVNIEDTTIQPEQIQFQDFSMNVNMELNKNQFVFNWLYHTNMNNKTGASITIIMILFLWYLYGLEKIQIYRAFFDILFFILLLYIASRVASEILSMICDIPPSVGMTLMGMALSNSGIFLKFNQNQVFTYLNIICEFIESVILIISGLEINILELRWTRFTMLKLAILPQLAEAVTVILVVHSFWSKFFDIYNSTTLFVLINLLGINSVLFMPSLENLKHLGYFDTNNIYNLLNVASTLTDMAAVIFNHFFIRCLYNECNLTGIIHVTIDISIDIIFGILWGLLIVFVTSPNCSKKYNVETCRCDNDQEVEIHVNQITSLLTTVKSVVLFFVVGFFTAIIKLYVHNLWTISLSNGISALVAGTYWRWRVRKRFNNNVLTMTYNDSDEHQNQVHEVLKFFKYIWKYLQPLFFVIIGAGFNINYFSFWMLFLVPSSLVFLLIIRVLITTFSIWEAGFNRNELLFINIAYLPNSTIMAGLLSIFLNFNHTFQVVTDYGSIQQLLNFTIISNLMTTILGSYTLFYYGPILLSTNVINNLY